MLVDFQHTRVELDLSANCYRGFTKVPEGPEGVDFTQISTTFRDYSQSTFAASTDTLLYPRFQWSSIHARLHRWDTVASIARLAAKYTASMMTRPFTPTIEIDLLVATYNRLKTTRLFSMSCIPDSLACLFFLADEGCHANYVIGVREDPFGAHAWLEINGAIANDDIFTTSRFKPILCTSNQKHMRQLSVRPAAKPGFI